MSQFEKLILKILSGTNDKNFYFEDLCKLLYLKFEERIKGSHHIFYKEGVDEITNIQPDNSKSKPYQVRQVRNLILKYKIGVNLDV